MSVGSAVVTAAGIRKIQEAQSTGRSIKPDRFGFSSDNLTVDPMLESISTWKRDTIDAYLPISDDTIEFSCVVEPDEAAAYTRLVGLYLDDGTLFAVAKPPFAMPPGLRQVVKVQIRYSAISEVMNFEYVPTDEIEQSLSVLDTSAAAGLRDMQMADELTMLSLCRADHYAFKRDATERIAALERDADEAKGALDALTAAQMDMQATLGYQLLQTSLAVGLKLN